jgi:hypothetical protein
LFKEEDWSITEDEGDFILEDCVEDLEFWDYCSELFKMFEFIILDSFSSEFKDFLDQSLIYLRNIRSWQ